MELRNVGGLQLVLFAPSELGVYTKPVRGGFAPISPATVLRDSGAQAALNGPMFGVCGGQDIPAGNAGYAVSMCDTLEYRHVDRNRSLDARGIHPMRGLTLSVHDGQATALSNDWARNDNGDGPDVAVQTYPTLVVDGASVAAGSPNVDRVWRSALALMNDGRMAFAVGLMPMPQFAQALAEAGARAAGYTDGGGSSRIQTATEAFGSTEGRPVPSWLVVRPASSSLGKWLAAGAVVATTLWLFSSGGVRLNPDAGFRNMAIRTVQAEERFVATVMDRGFTRAEALKILAVYRKLKLVKMDAVNGTLTVKHGAYWDQDVLRRALERT